MVSPTKKELGDRLAALKGPVPTDQELADRLAALKGPVPTDQELADRFNRLKEGGSSLVTSSAAPKAVVGQKRAADQASPSPEPAKRQRIESAPAAHSNQARIDQLQKQIQALVAKQSELLGAQKAPISERMVKLKGAVERVDSARGNTAEMATYNKLEAQHAGLKKQYSAITNLETHAKRFPRSDAPAKLQAAKKAFEADGKLFKARLNSYSEKVSGMYGESIKARQAELAALKKQPAAGAQESTVASPYATPTFRPR